jgi:hypothetical protein
MRMLPQIVTKLKLPKILLKVLLRAHPGRT